MHELDSILETWRTLGGRQRDAVLATVVHVEGSAYRRPGARMLIVSDGRRIGSISGGCLEGELVQKAWWFTEGGVPVVRVYDTSSGEDAVWEFGLGCNGVVQVMLERVCSDSTRELLLFLDGRRRDRRPSVVATVVRGSVTGQRLMLTADGDITGALHDSPYGADALRHASAAMQEKRSRLARIGECEVFVEFLPAPLPVVIFGAGHDAVPLVAIGKELGWRLTVADGRPAYARPDRFPGAERVVILNGGDPMRDLAIDEETAVVMMTHNYPLDQRLLPRILKARPRYLGMLGPASRAERLFAELQLERPEFVHAPVGLDLGSDNPAAIAVAIAAEIQACASGRAGGKLRLRQGGIHSPARVLGGAGEAVDGLRPEFCETMLGQGRSSI
jgi:xanthine dehydrogenase accessory factor